MRILIVSYSYAPALTPRAFRWSAIAEWMTAHGHKVDVICAQDTESEVVQVINGVNIHRVGGNIREIVKRKLGMASSTIATSHNDQKTMTANAASRFRNMPAIIYRYTLRKILWPDFAGFWYPPALKRARCLIEQSRHDVVISVSLPFTGHLIGLVLKHRYPIRWIVDIGDPFSFMSETPVNNHRLFRKLNYYAESKVLSGADGISVTTKGTKEKYLDFFPAVDSHKINVIPPLFVPPKDIETPSPFFPGGHKIRLVFTGTLYSKIRNPAALLVFFKSLLAASPESELELHFFGVINDCEHFFKPYAELINRTLFLHGLVPRVSAVRAMKEATVLVNLGNTTTYQLPSKVVEYIMLAKPVLNITSLGKDSSRIFFSDFASVCTVTEEALLRDPATFSRVKTFLENPPKVLSEEVNRLSETYGIQAIANRYLQLIEGDVLSCEN